MNIEAWYENEHKKGIECVRKSLHKICNGKKIDFLNDLIPELKDLTAKNYTVLPAAYDIETCEKYPQYNLGFLLNSSLYDNIVVPMIGFPDRSSFEIAYGLGESRGSHINYAQFLELVRNKKLRLCVTHDPRHYKAGFYEEIFGQCEEPPCFPAFRVGYLLNMLKLIQLSETEKMPLEPEKLLKLHPEYDITSCAAETKRVFGDYLNKTAEISEPLSRVDPDDLSSELWSLRSLGFEGTCQVALDCAQLCKPLGYEMLTRYHEYLFYPIASGCFAFKNYDDVDVERMLFLKLISKDLAIVWEDVLSSSPLCSSVASNKTCLNMVELSGMDLIKLADRWEENVNVKNLRQQMTKTNDALSKFDIQTAERSVRRMDEIITESVNSEVTSYQKKGKMSRSLLRVGKTFASMASEGLVMLSGLMAATGKFEWMATALAGASFPAWLRYKLDDVKPRDIVRWWSKTWPFEDPGIGFVIWQMERAKETSRKYSESL